MTGAELDDPARDSHHATAAVHGKAACYGLIALLFFGTALAYLDRQVLALLKPTLVVAFHWTDAEFAHLGSVFSLATAAAPIFSGWFVDRFGVRIAYGVAVAAWSLAGMAHTLAATVQQFVIARAVLAVTESVNGPAGVKSAAQFLPLRERLLGLGVITAATSFGAILAPLAIPPLAVTFGWHAAFLVTCARLRVAGRLVAGHAASGPGGVHLRGRPAP